MKDVKLSKTERLYLALQEVELNHEAFANILHIYLNEAGHADLTVCPKCKIDDFTHVEGCEFIRNSNES